MGYCMDQSDTDILIPKEFHSLMLQKIKSIMTDTEAMQGGSWGGDAPNQKWYSWVPTEKVLEAKTVEDALKAWRWEASLNAGGDINHLSFRGEKLGQDNILFEAIAPYVKWGSYISMRGEDGALWRWFFDDQKLFEQEGKVIYE
jgi:hypothetical protein